jgi:hypothetical protein
VSGFWLGIASLAVGAAGWGLWMRRINAVDVPLRPWNYWLAMGLGALLSITAFASEPGVLGGLAAGVGLLLCAIYLVLTNISTTPRQPARFTVGLPAPDFSAPDSTGAEFTLSSLRGAPVLLKFFRGHW